MRRADWGFIDDGPTGRPVGQWIRAKHVIPVHYDTFPGIKQDAGAFCDELAKTGIQGHPLKAGETLEI